MLMGAHRNPKIARLQRLSGESRKETIATLELLWLFTMEQAPHGDVGKWEDRDIEEACLWEGEPGGLVAALVEAVWLDACEDHRLLVHDWEEHAPEFLKKRQRRALDKIAKGEGGEPYFGIQRNPTESNGGQRIPIGDQRPNRNAKPSQAKPSQAKPSNAGISDTGVSSVWSQVIEAFEHYGRKPSEFNDARRKVLKRVVKEHGRDGPAHAVHGYVWFHQKPRDDFDPGRNFNPETVFRASLVAKYLDAYREACVANRSPPFPLWRAPPPAGAPERSGGDGFADEWEARRGGAKA